MSKNMLIKTFKTRKNSYLYDTNKNTILCVNDKQYNALDKLNDSDNDTEFNELKCLYNLGFLSNNKVEDVVHQANDRLEYYLENNISMLVLQVTQQCNFRCEYCTYSGNYFNREHSNKEMEISTALKGIDFLIEHSSNLNTIYIAFYGGEPLLRFDLVKECIEYAEKKTEGKRVVFTMTTNASLLTEEKSKFLSEHKVEVLISLDGSKEIQNSHRKFAANNEGTFDTVISNIKRIKEKELEFVKNVTFNSVVDTKNDFDKIDDFFRNDELIKDMDAKFSLINDGFKNSETIIEYEYYIKSEYQYFKLLYNIIKKGNIDNASKMVVSMYRELQTLCKKLTPQKKLAKKMNPSGQCIAGTARLFLNADGEFYPCEKASESSEELSIGTLKQGFDVNKVRNIINIGKLNKEKCKDCWIIRLCGLCAASIFNTQDSDYRKHFDDCCSRVESSVIERLKDYCMLREFGYKFPEEMYDEEDNKELWI